jgi:hypothetical protein
MAFLKLLCNDGHRILTLPFFSFWYLVLPDTNHTLVVAGGGGRDCVTGAGTQRR